MGFFEFLRTNFMHVLPLLVAAAIASAIIIERVRTLMFSYTMPDVNGFFDKIAELMIAGKTNDAVAVCDKYNSKPLARMVKAALLKAHLPEGLIEHAIQYSVGESTQLIQKRTSFLAMIANVATLLGLFGTIAGLIASFEAVGHADAQQKAALLSAGIATAMNATMLGLGVAIPCMVAFSFLMNRSNRLIGELENCGIRTLEILKQRYYAFDKASGENWESNDSSGNTPRGKVISFGRAA